MVLLRTATFDEWTGPMYSLRVSIPVNGLPPVFPTFFFVFVIVVGGFFSVNLILALIFDEYLQSSLIERIESEVHAHPNRT